MGLKTQILGELEKARQQDADLMHSLRDQLLSSHNHTSSADNPLAHHCCCSSVNISTIKYELFFN